MKQLVFKPDIDLERLAWGRPDAPRRPLCASCHGALPEVPLIAWREDGATISLCDRCCEQLIEVRDVDMPTPASPGSLPKGRS